MFWRILLPNLRARKSEAVVSGNEKNYCTSWTPCRSIFFTFIKALSLKAPPWIPISSVSDRRNDGRFSRRSAGCFGSVGSCPASFLEGNVGENCCRGCQNINYFQLIIKVLKKVLQKSSRLCGEQLGSLNPNRLISPKDPSPPALETQRHGLSQQNPNGEVELHEQAKPWGMKKLESIQRCPGQRSRISGTCC